MEQFLTGKTRQPELSVNWETKRLGEFVSVRNEKVLPSDVAPETPCVELNHIVQDKGRLLQFSTAQQSKSLKYRFYSGDVLFGRLRPYLRKYWLSDRDGICTTEIWPFVTDPLKADNVFFLAIIQCDQFIKAASISYGTHMPRADWSIIKNLEICLPKVREQRIIAGILSDVDGLLDALDASIAKKRDIKQAAMQQLLTGKTRLPGFRGEWKNRRLGNTLKCLPTASNPRSDLNEFGEVEYIHYGDVHAHSQPVLNCQRTVLPRIEGMRVEKSISLEDGDLVMVDASEDLAGVGKSVEVQGVGEKRVIAGLHTILCRGHPDHWAMGFKAFLQFVPALKLALVRMASGTSVYAISKKQLADVDLSLPSLLEQEAIVSVLSDMGSEIEALEQRRDKTRAIKQGMMQQLLTGRIRLVKSEQGNECSKTL